MQYFLEILDLIAQVCPEAVVDVPALTLVQHQPPKITIQ